MLLDSTFLVHLEKEVRRRQADPRYNGGPALRFLSAHRGAKFSISPVCAGEFYAGCDDFTDARRFLARFNRLELTDSVVIQAGLMEREQRAKGEPLGENDNWIAATARTHGRPVVSNDRGFDGVRGVKRVAY